MSGGAWASTDITLTSARALELELQQAVAVGLSASEYGRLAYELRGVQHPYMGAGHSSAFASPQARRTRAEAARASLKTAYERELALARGGLMRSLRGFGDRVAQAGARGIDTGDFADQVAPYWNYAGQATTITEYRDLTDFLAPKQTTFHQFVADFQREDAAAREALRSAQAALAEAAAIPNLQLAAFRAAIEQAAEELRRARTGPALQAPADRLRKQHALLRDLLDMRATAYGVLELAEATLRRAQQGESVDVGELPGAIAALRVRLAAAGTSDAFASIADALGQQRRALLDAIWLASIEVTVPIPVSRQEMKLDCETAALQMALAFFGYQYSQSALFALENPDIRPPVMGPDHSVLQWGNPYTNYVGDVNGDPRTPTGYGVYYPVILKIANSHGVPNAYGREGFTPAAIYAQVAARHPVQVWVEFGWAPAKVGVWTAWDGTRVQYSPTEHSVVLSGVKPGMVRINDPWHGEQYWISKATFESSWRDFNNMAIVYR